MTEVTNKKATQKSADQQDMDDLERVRFMKANIICPECYTETAEKIKFSLAKSVPNLIICKNCGTSHILIQRAEIKTETIELKKAMDEVNAKFAPPAPAKKSKKAAEVQDPFAP